MQYIKNRFNYYFRTEDKTLIALLLLVLPITLAYYLVNLNSTHYAMPPIIDTRLFVLLGAILLIYIGSLSVRNFYPRAGLVTWTYSMFFFLFIANNIMVYYLKSTPFPTIDTSLVKVDQFLGFHQTTWLNWTYAHPFIEKLLSYSYTLLIPELIIVPFILAMLLQRRAILKLFISLTISFIAGSAIYYFFPTTAPASMFFDPHFTAAQHDTFIKFFELHHHLPITTSEGGLVAFPSFHVIWATLLAYAFRQKKYFFYPAILFNALVILSTFMLGWHYLIDVIAGLLLAGLSILTAEIYCHYRKHSDTEIVRGALASRLANHGG